MVFAHYPRSQDERDWDSHDVRTAYDRLAAAGVVSDAAAEDDALTIVQRLWAEHVEHVQYNEDDSEYAQGWGDALNAVEDRLTRVAAAGVVSDAAAEAWDEGWRAAQQIVELEGVKCWAHTVFPEGYEGNPYRAAVSGVAAGSKAEHHPNCYQVTGAIPEDLPGDVCDCRVLRMIDAHTVAASKADTDEADR